MEFEESVESAIDVSACRMSFPRIGERLASKRLSFTSRRPKNNRYGGRACRAAFISESTEPDSKRAANWTGTFVASAVLSSRHHCYRSEPPMSSAFSRAPRPKPKTCWMIWRIESFRRGLKRWSPSSAPSSPVTAIRRSRPIRIWIIEMRWNCNCCWNRCTRSDRLARNAAKR